MDVPTQEAFERVIAQIKSHPLYLLAPADAEAQLRAAIADGIDRREAVKIQKALDTPEERAAIIDYVQTLGIAKGDVNTMLQWLRGAVVQALEDAEPVEVDPDKPEPTGEPIDVSAVQWIHKGAGGYRVAAKATGKLDNLIRMELDKPLGPACTLGIIILREGVYYGGTIDGVGDNPTRINKTPNNIKGGDKGGPLIGRGGPKRNEAESRAYLRLAKGETFWVYVQCDSRRTRSTVVPMVWNQDGASAPAPTPQPGTMPTDLPGVGQSGFLWKPNAEGGGGGLVVLFNGKLIPFIKSATINGANKVKQVPPYEDGRGALRWSGKTFGGAATLAMQLTDGRELRYAIPNGKARTERVRPTVA